MNMPMLSLKDVANFINGKAFKPTDWSEEGLPIIRIQNLNGLEKPFNYWAGPLDKEVNVKRNDLLLAWSGTPGTSFGAHIWRGGAAVLNQHIFRVDLKEYLVTKEWAKFVINAQLNTLIGMAHGGVGLQHVTKGMVEGLEIPVPPLPEQRRIAAILDQADALRAKRREALAQLDSLTQSIFIEMFGDPVSNPKNWSVKPLSECSERIQIGPFGTQLHEEDYIDGGIPLINPTHLRGGVISPDSSLTVSPEKYRELSNYYLLAGDLIMGRRGEMGRCAVITNREQGWLCGTGSLFVRPKTDVLSPTYLGLVISSPSMRRFLENVAQGVTMANLNKTIVGSLPIAIPPIAMQQAFVSQLNATQSIKNHSLNSLAELDTLFASLQHRAFRGEL